MERLIRLGIVQIDPATGDGYDYQASVSELLGRYRIELSAVAQKWPNGAASPLPTEIVEDLLDALRPRILEAIRELGGQ